MFVGVLAWQQKAEFTFFDFSVISEIGSDAAQSCQPPLLVSGIPFVVVSDAV